MAAYLAATTSLRDNVVHPRKIRRKRQYQFENLPADKAMRDYRLSPHMINYLEDILDDDIGPIKIRPNALSTRQKILTSLKVLATGGFQNIAKDSINIAQQTVSDAFSQFINAMYEKRSDYIKMPNAEEQRISKQHFQDTAGFRDVIGLIDGTLIPIIGPRTDTHDEKLYVCRKGYHAINMQVDIFVK